MTWGRTADAHNDAEEVDVEDLSHDLDWSVGEVSDVSSETRIVDQAGHRSQPLLRDLEEGLHLVIVGYVCLDRQGSTACASSHLDDPLSSVAVAAIVHDDVVAAASEVQRSGRADTPACPGDDRDAPRHLLHRAIMTDPAAPLDDPQGRNNVRADQRVEARAPERSFAAALRRPRSRGRRGIQSRRGTTIVERQAKTPRR
jgi:hypothetical protein